MDAAAPVDRATRELVSHFNLSLNKQQVVRRVLARVKVKVPGIDVQNVYGAPWAEAATADFLERDGELDDDPDDHMDLGDHICRQLEPREYPISATPYDDAANWFRAFGILF